MDMFWEVTRWLAPFRASGPLTPSTWSWKSSPKVRRLQVMLSHAACVICCMSWRKTTSLMSLCIRIRLKDLAHVLSLPMAPRLPFHPFVQQLFQLPVYRSFGKMVALLRCWLLRREAWQHRATVFLYARGHQFEVLNHCERLHSWGLGYPARIWKQQLEWENQPGWWSLCKN